MPNWAMNILEVKAESTILDAIMQDLTIDGTTMTYSALIPAPDEDGVDYRWACEHWGCKWDAHASSISRQADSIIAGFDSPWCPPIPWIEALIAKYPEASITLKSAEPGMDVHLEYEGRDGRLLVTAEDDFGAHAAEWGFDDYNEEDKD